MQTQIDNASDVDALAALFTRDKDGVRPLGDFPEKGVTHGICAVGGDGKPTGYEIDNSLRFNRGDNPNLEKLLSGSTTSTTKCTISLDKTSR